MVCVWFGPFWIQKAHFTAAYCQQIFVADSFKKPSFWIHVSHKISKLIFFSAYFVCIAKVDRCIRFDLQKVKL